MHLRHATLDDLPLLGRWDEQPHVVASDPNDDWNWAVELAHRPGWREMLIAESDGRPIGFLQIIDPAREDTRYWGDVPDGLRAIDIWIGESEDLGRGYGTQMMRLALARCFANPDVSAILIDPLATNVRAHRFYERLGFRFVERRRFGDDECFVYRLDRSAAAPLLVYGTDCSYFTGKLEAYLRAKGIAYRLVPFGPSNMKRAARHTGVTQIPQVECGDGSWLVDTTRILEHFECVRPEPAMHSQVPSVAFLSLLIEDFADEWLWRPAMHWRWSFPENARLMSAWLAEHAAESRAPLWLKRWYWRRRQLGTFVRGDGVDAATRGAVERTYFDLIDALERIFARRPYVLGERPLEADFGLFGPLFRHFASDPAPARVMRERAPGVYEWVARMWNARPERFDAIALPDAIPDDLDGLLAIITQGYLPYLEANAVAYARGERRVRHRVQGTPYEEPTKPYRVWCRDRLRAHLLRLDAGERSAVERALAAPEALSQLCVPSPKPAEDLIGTLPIPPTAERAPVDSWWRRR